MDSQAHIREGLHKMIEQIKDVSILQAVYVILEREQKLEESELAFYDTLDPAVQASIERGLEQVERGETVPHEEVRKRYEKWLK